MLRGVKSTLGYKVKVSEGQCGLVYDFLFDDQSWQINRVVVRIGVPQETLRLFPLSPTTAGAIVPEDRTFVLRTMSSAILSSPLIDTDPPVSRQRRRRLSALKIVIPFLPDEFAGVPVPMAFTPAPASPGTSNLSTQASTEQEANWDAHLRSVREVIGYRIQALDGRRQRAGTSPHGQEPVRLWQNVPEKGATPLTP